ncbi:MAG: DUF4352 domain-containing protein [Bacillota bacterium]
MIRKRLALLLAALMILAVGCGKNAPDPNAVPAAGGSSQGSGSSGSSGSGSTVSNPSGSSSSNSSGSNSAGTGSNTSGQKEQQPSAPAEKVKLGPLKVGETAKVHVFEVTLHEVGLVTKAGGLPPGYGYMLIRFTVKNGSNGQYAINVTDHFKLMQPDGKPGRYNISATAQRNPKLGGTLAPGDSGSGWAGYLIKLGSGTFKLTYTHPDFGEAVWEIPQ